MSSIVNFDRDLYWISSPVNEQGFSDEIGWQRNPNVSTDGTVQSQVANNGFYDAVTLSCSLNHIRASGVNLTGPDQSEGSPYRIKGYAYEFTGTYTIYLMYGIGSLSPSPHSILPAGNTVLQSYPIKVGKEKMYFDETIYIKSFNDLYPGQGYEKNPVTFFVMLHCHDAGAVSTITNYRLSVQRLIAAPPEYNTNYR